MEITLNITISFIIGLSLGGVGGYTFRLFFSNRSQRSAGDQSPNIMGDKNSVNY